MVWAARTTREEARESRQAGCQNRGHAAFTGLTLLSLVAVLHTRLGTEKEGDCREGVREGAHDDIRTAKIARDVIHGRWHGPGTAVQGRRSFLVIVRYAIYDPYH